MVIQVRLLDRCKQAADIHWPGGWRRTERRRSKSAYFILCGLVSLNMTDICKTELLDCKVGGILVEATHILPWRDCLLY